MHESENSFEENMKRSTGTDKTLVTLSIWRSCTYCLTSLSVSSRIYREKIQRNKKQNLLNSKTKNNSCKTIKVNNEHNNSKNNNHNLIAIILFIIFIFTYIRTDIRNKIVI